MKHLPQTHPQMEHVTDFIKIQIKSGSAATPEMKSALERMVSLAPKLKMTHSHLSKVEKTQKVINTLKDKIVKLEWAKFQKLVDQGEMKVQS